MSSDSPLSVDSNISPDDATANKPQEPASVEPSTDAAAALPESEVPDSPSAESQETTIEQTVAMKEADTSISETQPPSVIAQPPDKTAAVETVAVETTATSAASDGVTSEPAPAEATPVKAIPVEATPAEATPVEATPVEATPAESTPAEATPVEATPVEATTAESTPAESTPVESTPAESTPVESTEAPPAITDESRVRLNPTVDQMAVVAVPSVVSTASVPPAAAESSPSAGAAVSEPSSTSTVDADAETAETASTPSSGKLPPVDLPPADAELSLDLEAEIEAAVKAEESATVVIDSQQQTDDDADAAVSATDEDALTPGTRLKGTVQSVHGDNVFIDIGARCPGVVSHRQFATDKPPSVGEAYDVIVDRVNESEGLVMLNLPRGRRSIAGNWDAVAKGQVVDCMVTKTNKGGLEIAVSSLRGFMPASQIDVKYVEDLEIYVGQKLRAVITEANPKKRNLIVSRRQYLDIERREAAEELWKTLEVGQTFTAAVSTIKDYGAFVDIGGVDGFLHIGEISWSRVSHPSEVLTEGQEIQVRVIKLDAEKNRISLGMKQLMENPWSLAASTYSNGSTVTGKVIRIMDFGAFVELEPGVEGLVHISELDYQRVNKVTDVLKVDQEVELKVLEVDTERRRIGLSLKQLMEKPQAPQPLPQEQATDAASAPSDEPPPPERKRKGPLKGGTGGSSGKEGMFGDPSDFT